MKLVDDLVFEFKGRHVVRKEGDIVLEGSNASAEGEDADDLGADEHVELGIDFVLNDRLVVSLDYVSCARYVLFCCETNF